MTTLLTIEIFEKLLFIVGLSSVKFLFSPSVSFLLGFDFIDTVLLTSVGGISGIVFFYFLSSTLLKLYSKLFSFSSNFSKHYFKRDGHDGNSLKSSSTKRRRLIIKTRRKYGLWGVIIFTPVLLSIPIGAFLAFRYYRETKYIVIYLLASVISWSILVSAICKLFISFF